MGRDNANSAANVFILEHWFAQNSGLAHLWLMGGKVETWSFYVFAIFLLLFVSPGVHKDVTKVTNFSEMYVFFDKFSDNLSGSQTQK